MQLGLRNYMESETQTPPASLSCFYASLSFTLFSQQGICLQSFSPDHLKHDCRELLNFIFYDLRHQQEPVSILYQSLVQKIWEKAFIGSAWGRCLPLSQSAVGSGQGHMKTWQPGSRKQGARAATKRRAVPASHSCGVSAEPTIPPFWCLLLYSLIYVWG